MPFSFCPVSKMQIEYLTLIEECIAGQANVTDISRRSLDG